MVNCGQVNIDDAPSISAKYEIGNLWTWSCASNSSGTCFIVGTEKKCMMFDVETGRHHMINTRNSDALSVSFANAVSSI
jgi:hypothetical protein